MRTSTLLLAAAALATVIPAFAQIHAGGWCSGTGADRTGELHVSVPPRMQPVTGAPYSAHESTESARTLADGTHIVNQSQFYTATWRDSFGRIRTEEHAAPGGRERCGSYLAGIQDPVAGYTSVIDPVTRTAYRVPLVARPARSAKELALEEPRVPRQGTQTIEPLGSRTMFGVSVVGTRTTRTAPPRPESGHDRSDSIIIETWTAPQLALQVYVKNVDQAQGDETVQTLKDLSTEEPDAALFQIPAGYKIIDEAAGTTQFKIAIGSRDSGTPASPPAPSPREAVCAFSFNFTVPLQVRAVTGAPYSARESMERTQTLADGSEEALRRPNRSERATWRDSSGRIRIEEEAGLAVGSAPCSTYVVRIEDPVAGYLYEVDSVNRIAHRVLLKPLPAIAAADIPLDRPVRSGDPSKTSESLGSKTISGVTVVGTRETITYPAGSMGNDRPLGSSREYWVSPQLGLEVSSRNSDWSGTSTRTLKDLSAAEPEASLFRIPARYKIVDETGSFTISIPRRDEVVNARR